MFSNQENLNEDATPTAIINSLKDWLDSGDDDAITGLSGAESSYYQSLDIPYPCKNGPVLHVGELALIKGIIPELLYYLRKIAHRILNHSHSKRDIKLFKISFDSLPEGSLTGTCLASDQDNPLAGSYSLKYPCPGLLMGGRRKIGVS